MSYESHIAFVEDRSQSNIKARFTNSLALRKVNASIMGSDNLEILKTALG